MTKGASVSTSISIGFGYFSGLCLAFVGFHLLWNENFAKHPYWMVAAQCLLIATVQINQYIIYLLFPIGMLQWMTWESQIMDSLFRLNFSEAFKTISHGPDFAYLDHKIVFEYRNAFVVVWKVTLIVAGILSIILNFLYILDQYLALRNPFYPRRKRSKWYQLTLVVVGISFAWSILARESYNEEAIATLDFFNTNGSDPHHKMPAEEKNFILVVRTVLYCFAAIQIIPTVALWVRLGKKGTSE